MPPTTEEKDAEAPTLSQGIAGAARPITKPRERKNTPAARQLKERFARGFQASMWGVAGALHGLNTAAAIITRPATAPTTTEAAVPEVTFSFASSISSTARAKEPERPERPEEPEPQDEVNPEEHELQNLSPHVFVAEHQRQLEKLAQVLHEVPSVEQSVE